MKTAFSRLMAWLFVSLFVFLSCASAKTYADSLSRFTGFTRPGTPNDDLGGGEIRLVADTEEGRQNGIGTTVYFTVLERTENVDDVWGTNLPEFASAFKPGLDFSGTSSPGLDTSAQYLYLYQTVNDRGTLSPIRSTSIKLIVEMKDITSWGYFSGVGFATEGTANVKRNVRKVRPVSYGNIVARERADRIYRDKAPFIPINKRFFLTQVPTRRGQQAPGDENGNKILRIQWDPLDPAINPDYVILLNRSDFKDKRPSFRAIWSEKNAIEKDRRSTVFGFTSNLPPTLEPVRVRGQRVQIQDGKIVPVLLDETPVNISQQLKGLADGVAPTPQPNEYVPAPDENKADPGFQNPGARSLSSGIQQVGGVPLSGGQSLLPIGNNDNDNTPPIIPGGTGGTQTVQEPASESELSVEVSQEQNVNQAQRQRQRNRQKQGQKGGTPAVVPAPPSLLLAGLGLPLLVFLQRRKFGRQK
ncbi:MAG: hypothetical protein ACFCD0_12165 [Gemmataceae bacterium]